MWVLSITNKIQRHLEAHYNLSPPLRVHFFLSSINAYMLPVKEFFLSGSTSEKIVVLIFFSNAYA